MLPLYIGKYKLYCLPLSECPRFRFLTLVLCLGWCLHMWVFWLGLWNQMEWHLLHVTRSNLIITLLNYIISSISAGNYLMKACKLQSRHYCRVNRFGSFEKWPKAFWPWTSMHIWLFVCLVPLSCFFTFGCHFLVEPEEVTSIFCVTFCLLPVLGKACHWSEWAKWNLNSKNKGRAPFSPF